MDLEQTKQECQLLESQLSPEILKHHLANVSYWKLNQKILQTLYYKQPFEDNSDFKKLKGSCLSACYDKITDKELKDMTNPLVSEAVLGKLQSCVKTCELPVKDAETYVDNIDFLAIQKLDGCSKSCASQ